MKGDYTDNPHNITEISSYVTMKKEIIVAEIIGSQKCYFYDACSFRRHANLDNVHAEYLLRYIKNQRGVVVITRCILMELASYSGLLKQEYIEYIKRISDFGIKVLIIYEEDLFSVMEVCFSTNKAINNYLCWAVRIIKGPVSTITATLEKDKNVYNEVVKGEKIDNSGVYRRFFEAVRENKEAGDDLGEEVLAICLHILSHIPGEEDGKFCVITDDKGAASKIDAMFKKTVNHYRGKTVGIFSTPKLVQVLYRENILRDSDHLKEILGEGAKGNIAVLGMLVYDIRGREISMKRDELADLIMQPNGISIFF